MPAVARSARPVQQPLAATAAKPADVAAQSAADAADPAHFTTDAKWALAGYNSDEVVYTITVTNQDPRILRCTTEMKGSYFEDGKKLDIQDRQTSTVFPNQQVQLGNWMGMDQNSDTSYSVKCRAI